MKRALITSGGGAKGAFTVGALKYLAENGVDHYDLISGTSTGSLIAALACLGDFEALEEIYVSVNNGDILNKQNVVDNIINHRPFIYDTDPLLELMKERITEEKFNSIMTCSTTLCLTAISLQSGRIKVFSTKPIAGSPYYDVALITSREQLLQALLASSSQAGFLKPVNIRTGTDSQGNPIFEQFVDGGNKEVIPTRAATVQMPDEIYVLSNNPMVLFPGEDLYDDVLKIIMRAIGIFIQDVRENDIIVLNQYLQQSATAKVFRIEPEHDLDPPHPTGLNFNFAQMTTWMGMGRGKAKLALQTNGRTMA